MLINSFFGPSSNELNLDRTSLRSKRRNAKEVAGVSPTHSSPLRSKLKKGRATFATPSACHSIAGLRPYSRSKPDLMFSSEMARGLIWTTAEDLARNRGRVLSLYSQILRSLNSPDLPLNLAARLAKKAEVHAIFMLASEERSLHNIEDLMDAADCSLSLLRRGEIPKYIQ